MEETFGDKVASDVAVHSLAKGFEFLLAVGKCNDELCARNDSVYHIRLMDNSRFNGLDLKIQREFPKSSCDSSKYRSDAKFFERRLENDANEFCLASLCYEPVALDKASAIFDLDVTCFLLTDLY